jgi:hypothetical protein
MNESVPSPSNFHIGHNSPPPRPYMSPNRHFVCATEFLELLETVAKGYRQRKRTVIDERRTRSQLVDNKGDRLLEGLGVGAGLGLDV